MNTISLRAETFGAANGFPESPAQETGLETRGNKFGNKLVSSTDSQGGAQKNGNERPPDQDYSGNEAGRCWEDFDAGHRG